MSKELTIMSVSALQSRQAIWPEWMAKATEGLQSHDLVEVEYDNTPFGRYVMKIEPVR